MYQIWPLCLYLRFADPVNHQHQYTTFRMCFDISLDKCGTALDDRYFRRAVVNGSNFHEIQYRITLIS